VDRWIGSESFSEQVASRDMVDRIAGFDSVIPTLYAARMDTPNRSVGRPALIQGGRKYTLTLTPADADKLRAAGDGSLSLGCARILAGSHGATGSDAAEPPVHDGAPASDVPAAD